MISPYKTTSLTARALSSPLALFLALFLALLLALVLALVLGTSLTLSAPLSALNLLSGDTPTALTAGRVEWDEAAGTLTARGVRLTQRPPEGGDITLTCPHATLWLSPRALSPHAPSPHAPSPHAEGQAPALTALHLSGGVRLEAAEGAVSAGEARWEVGGALTLTGGAVGEWRGQRVEADRVTLDLSRRLLTLEGVRARLMLPALTPEGRVSGARPPKR